MLNAWREMRNPSPSVDAYLRKLKNIHPDPIWKDWALVWAFWRRSLQQEEEEQVV